MIKLTWMVESIGVVFLGATVMEDMYLKILVGLCGLISLILSITFGGLLKHLHDHNKELRTKDECNAMHESSLMIFNTKIDVATMKIDALHNGIKTVEQCLLSRETGKTSSDGPKTDSRG